MVKYVSLENLTRFAQNIDTEMDTKAVKTEVDSALAGKVDVETGKRLMTDAEGTKLGGIAEGAQVNVLEGIKVNGTAQAVTDKAVNIDLSAYALKADYVSVMRYKGTVDSVATLPADATVGDVYNVTENGANYAWSGSEWDQLGGAIDLSGYYTKGEVDQAIATATDDMATQAYVDGEVTTLEGAIALKANSADVYTKTEIDGKVSTLETSIGTKANSADVYTKAQVDSAIDADVKVVNDRVTSEVATINSTLAGKVNTSDLEAITEAEIDAIFPVA